jgi:hypothetical protein
MKAKSASICVTFLVALKEAELLFIVVTGTSTGMITPYKCRYHDFASCA